MMAISYPQGKFTGSGKSERESVRQRLRFILNEKTKVDWQVSEPEILFPILSSFLPTHDDGCLDKSVADRWRRPNRPRPSEEAKLVTTTTGRSTDATRRLSEVAFPGE